MEATCSLVRRRRAALIVLLMGSTGALMAQPTMTPEEVDQAVERLQEASAKAFPRVGRVIAAYRERGHPLSETVIIWDSAEPEKYPKGPLLVVPAWLPLVLTLRFEELRDGYGELYSGPLMVKPSGGEILGPYPEGFVCAIEGAFEVVMVPTFPPFTEGRVGVEIDYRWPPIFIEVDGQPWPHNPDGGIGIPAPQEAVWGVSFRSSNFDMEKGYRLGPVTTEVVGHQRVLTAPLYFAMADGKPARKLPLRFEWCIVHANGEEERIVHEAQTNHRGEATDTAIVPREVSGGYVRIWFRTLTEDYLNMTSLKFDFTEDDGE